MSIYKTIVEPDGSKKIVDLFSGKETPQDEIIAVNLALAKNEEGDEGGDDKDNQAKKINLLKIVSNDNLFLLTFA